MVGLLALVRYKRMAIESANEALFDVQHWTYISEGALNMVFRYTGTDSRFQHTVLRLRKVKLNQGPNLHDPLDPHYMWRESMVFREQVLLEHIGRKYLTSCGYIHVPRSFLERLAEKTESIRPLNRRQKSYIEYVCVLFHSLCIYYIYITCLDPYLDYSCTRTVFTNLTLQFSVTNSSGLVMNDHTHVYRESMFHNLHNSKMYDYQVCSKVFSLTLLGKCLVPSLSPCRVS